MLPPPLERVSHGEIHAGPIPHAGASLALAEDRPCVVLNMVSSLDGKTSVDGKAGTIGGDVDRLVMRLLRSKVDAVMVGAGTVRAEKVNLGTPKDISLDEAPKKRDRLGVVLSPSGNLPPENILLDKDQTLLIITSTHISEAQCHRLLPRVLTEAVLNPESPEEHLRLALGMLKRKYQVDTLLVEGGPSLNHALVDAGLVDEVFVTLAPKILGGRPGETSGIVDGPQLPQERPSAMSLTAAYTASSELYLRYTMNHRCSVVQRASHPR